MLSAAVLLALHAAAPASAQKVVVDENARGAWFRKVAGPLGSDFDGIEAWGVLPKPSFDTGRQHAPAKGEPAYTAGPLDRPDVYVGLHADGAEVDAGLTWDHAYDAQGRDTGKWGYRVYWRTAGGGWKNPAAGSPEDLTFRPGDRFALTLRVRPDGSARLAVRRAGRDEASRAFEFAVPGLLARDGKLKPLQFKRVHAIDQFVVTSAGTRKGNEGAPAIATFAAMRGGRWEGAHLLSGTGRRALSGDLATVVQGADAVDRYGAVFPAAGVGPGGAEEILVVPPRP